MNTGKNSQDAFVKRLSAHGKSCVVHRFIDAAEMHGRTGSAANARTAPCDYLVVFRGSVEFAEVKSTEERISFPFGMIKTSQSSFATKVRAAGGQYFFYVHSLFSGEWYRVPWAVIETVKVNGKSSIKWVDLEPYRW